MVFRKDVGPFAKAYLLKIIIVLILCIVFIFGASVKSLYWLGVILSIVAFGVLIFWLVKIRKPIKYN